MSMKKTLQALWKTYCQPVMQRMTKEQADSQILITQAKSTIEAYARRRQLKLSTDAELGRKFQRLFDNSLVAMSFYDKDGYLLDLNDKMRELCAIDTIGEEFFRTTCLFDTPSFLGDYERGSKEPFYVCQHMLYPDLHIDRYIEVHIQPILDAREQLLYYVITTRDISYERTVYREQKERSQEAQHLGSIVSDYEQKLNYLLRSSNMFVWWLDLDTRRISFTRSLKKQEFSETIDEYLDSLYDDQRAEAAHHMSKLLTHPHTFSTKHHFRYTPANPNPTWLYINGQPVLDHRGRVVALFGILRDVTSMMETQYQLHKEQQRAAQSAYLKSVYLANLSHEIRTPLNAIVGFSDLLHVVDDPAERQEFIRIIRNNSDMLLRLINDILEASDMGLGVRIEPANIDFAQTFDDICHTVAQHVEEAGVQFVKDNPYETLPTVLDRGRIQQIVTNFVSNAIKYTHEGHIKVGYRIEQRDGRSGLYVYCEDTGAGIPSDKQASVFDRFVKLDDRVQGTGLGLSICKNIVNHCGGQIGVHSDGADCGSTFWFWIPCELPKNAQ
jgi:signal transduction histidine kinase